MKTLARHPAADNGSIEDIDADRLVRRRYDRLACVYDALAGVDLLFTREWRRELWSRIAGPRVLEVGVGSGVNFAFYPRRSHVLGIDIAPKMLDAARRRADRMGLSVDLELGDVQSLRFLSGSFDAVVSTFVFCSVPDPMAGLRELRRVLRPGGQLLLLEHVVSPRPWLAHIMRWLDPLVIRIAGAHIARDTIGNVQSAGFENVVGRPLFGDIVQHVEALAPGDSI
jgi:ubiquinone/menaquinone biosynthesis C-methylase UbiE